MFHDAIFVQHSIVKYFQQYRPDRRTYSHLPFDVEFVYYRSIKQSQTIQYNHFFSMIKAPIPSIQPSQRHNSPPLYHPAQLELKAMPALKKAFNHWLRSLPMEERFLVLKIHAQPLPQVLRKLLPQLQLKTAPESSEKITSQETSLKSGPVSQNTHHTSKIEKGFSDTLVFVSDGGDYLDHICFEFGQLECPDKLFDLLTSNLQAPQPCPMQEAIKTRKSPKLVVEQLGKCVNREQIAQEVISFLRKEVLNRFKESMRDPQLIRRSLQEEKRRKKQFSLHWKYLPADMKRRLLFLGHTSLQPLAQWLSIQKLEIKLGDLKKEMEQLLKLEKNQFCNRILKCKIKKCTAPIISYYELVYNFWRRELEMNRKRRQRYMQPDPRETQNYVRVGRDLNALAYQESRRSSKRKSNSVESSETIATMNEISTKAGNFFKEQAYSTEDQLRQQDQLSSYHFEKKIEHGYPKLQRKPAEKKSAKKTEAQWQKPSKKFQRQKNESFSTIEQALKQRKASKSNRSFSKLPFKSETPLELPQESIISEQPQLNAIVLSKLSEELQQISDSSSEQANKFHERRLIAYERIQFLLGYYQIPIKLFGSCASGIAIKNSDIDIAVDHSMLAMFDYLPEEMQLGGALQSLEQLFQSQPCFTHIKLIKTATVPLVKLTMNTSVTFLDPSYGSTYCALNRSHYSGPIDADVSVQTVNKMAECNHLGVISTQTINKWLTDIPSLRPIVILMKQLLRAKRYNIAYEGGMNTFSMIVLLVSYIFEAKMEKETNPALVLKEVLKFYAHEFNQKDIGIDLAQYEKGHIFYAKQQKENNKFLKLNIERASLQVLDPICEGKNMTRNCYLFSEMKKFFKEVLEVCYQRGYRDLNQLTKQQNEEMDFGEVEQKYREKFAKRNVFADLLEQLSTGL